MRTTRMAAIAGALALLLGACGGGGGDGASGDGSGSGGEAETRGKVDPVEVTLEVDAAATAKATIGPDGGTVGTSGADGTAYELVVPAGALVEPVEISLAPVAEMVGLPEGDELSSGVEMEPDGLVFMKPAWLYIDAEHTDVDAGLLVDEGIASLQPVGFDGDRYILPVGHFTTGGTLGPGTGLPGWDNRMPPSPTGQSLQGGAIDAGGPVDVPSGFPGNAGSGRTPPGPGGEGGSGVSGGGGSPASPSLTDGWGDSAGNAGNAGDGAGGAADAGTEFDAEIGDWAREAGNAQMTGDEEGEAAADKKLDKIKEKIRDRIDEIAEACYSEKDVTKLLHIIRLQIRGQMLGFDDDYDEATRQSEIVKACGRFEMKADGKAMFDAPPVFEIGDSVTVTVPLEFEGLGHDGKAGAQLDPVGYDRGAEVLEVFGQGMAMFLGMEMPNDLTANDHIKCSVSPPHVNIEASAANLFKAEGLQVGVTFENRDATVTCPDPIGSFPMSPFSTDLEMMREMGIPEVTEAGLLLETWERPADGKPWAKTKVDAHYSEGGMSFTLTWDFTINHEPAPPPKRK